MPAAAKKNKISANLRMWIFTTKTPRHKDSNQLGVLVPGWFKAVLRRTCCAMISITCGTGAEGKTGERSAGKSLKPPCNEFLKTLLPHRAVILLAAIEVGVGELPVAADVRIVGANGLPRYRRR